MLEMIVLFEHRCPTCNMMMPLIEEVAEDYADKMEVTWIDTELHPQAMGDYGAEVVPTIILRRDQTEVARMAGMIGETLLRERIEKNACIS